MRKAAVLLAALAALASPATAAGTLFVASGEGTATFLTQYGTRSDTCPAMQALVEWHQRFSNEPVFTANFAGGQGAPVLLCSSGWRLTFMPNEVQGDPEHGWVAHRSSPDAIIDLTLSAAGQGGSRSLAVRQVTFPSGIADTLAFDGHVAQVV
jgi:hypothetical protein